MSPYLIDQYDEKTFPKEQPLYVEIGMGKGKFLIENALLHPKINYLGIDKFDNVLARALPKIPEGLENIRILRMDASKIEEQLSSSVDQIYLNFSDPWPKKRHAERRLTSPSFLKRYEHISKGDVRLHFKTDNRPLFEYSLFSFLEAGYHLDELSLDLHHSGLEGIITTEYEEKFVKLGHPIYYAVVSKKSVH